MPRNHSEAGFSRASINFPGITSFSEAHETVTKQDSIYPSLGTTYLYPGQETVLETFDLIKKYESPIQFAYFLSGVNENLKEVVDRKKNKLKRKALDETLSDETSTLNFTFQDQCFSKGVKNLNGLRSNSLINHSFVPCQNGSKFSTCNNDPDGISGTHSFLFERSRNNRSAFHTRATEIPSQKFSRLNDTFATSVECYLPNNPVSQEAETSRRRLPFSRKPTYHSSVSEKAETSQKLSLSAKPTYLHSTFGKMKTNLCAFPSNNSILNIRNRGKIQSEVSKIAKEEDQFSCVRAVAPGTKFHLSKVVEDEEEVVEKQDTDENSNVDENSCDTASSEEEEDTFALGTPASRLRSSASKVKKNQINQSSIKIIILKNWTVILRNEAFHLKGIKLLGDSIIERNHISDVIVQKTVGCNNVITKNGLIYKLECPFVANPDMPSKVKDYFKNNKFPHYWRHALKMWISERLINENNKKREYKTKLKSSPPAVLKQNIKSTNYQTNINKQAIKAKSSQSGKNEFSENKIFVQMTNG